MATNHARNDDDATGLRPSWTCVFWRSLYFFSCRSSCSSSSSFSSNTNLHCSCRFFLHKHQQTVIIKTVKNTIRQKSLTWTQKLSVVSLI